MGIPLQRFVATQVTIDPDVAREAALTLCDRAADAADARQLLEACGLIEYQRGDFRATIADRVIGGRP